MKNKRIKTFLSIIMLSLCCSCVMIMFVASGSATSLIGHWTINRHADARRADEMATLTHELSMQREQELALAKTARAKSFLTVQVIVMGLGVVAVGIGIVGFGRLMLGRTRSMREGAVIAHAAASKQPVPQSLTYSPRTQHSIKDVTTGQLGQSPAQLLAPSSDDLAGQITATLAALGLAATTKQIAVGPQVLTFGITPMPSDTGKLTTVSQISQRADDLAVALTVQNIRIKAAPGYIGLEVPRLDRELVELGDLLGSKEWRGTKAHLPLALGKDTKGEWVVHDLVKLPHLLVGGATGGGKSVAVNSMLVGLMNRYTPNELSLLLIDPKQVELIPYSDSPYLAQPVVTDATLALPVLEGAIEEMEARYTLLALARKKNIISYNKVAEIKLPWLVIVIDEFADLIMVAEEVEGAVVRLAQKSRAVGMHIILATQRPSKDVVTGLIKMNMPARMSLAVPDGINSKIILDEMGAEALLGRGDGLFKSQDISTIRVQAPYISDDELAEFLGQPVAPQLLLTQSPQIPTISPVSPVAGPVAGPVAPVAPPVAGPVAEPVAPVAAPVAPVAQPVAPVTGPYAPVTPESNAGDSAKAIAFSIWDENPDTSHDEIMESAGIDKRGTVRSYKTQWREARGLK